MKEAIATNQAPQAIGPYSQAVRCGNLLFCSGQIALDPTNGQMVGGGIVAETQCVLNNLRAVLAAAGAGFQHVVRTTIYLTDLTHFTAVNELYGKCFEVPFPARVTVGVSTLPRGGLVEIDAIALLES